MAYVYHVRGDLVELRSDPNLIAVRFAGKPPHSLRERTSRALSDGAFSSRFEVAGERITILPVSNLGTDLATARANQDAAIQKLDADPLVASVRPVFRIGESKAVAPDRIIIGFDDPSRRTELVNKYALQIVRERDEKIVAETPERGDVFDIIAAIHEESGVRFVEPDLVVIGRNAGRRRGANSGLASVTKPERHYAHKLIKAHGALALQTGSPNISVAILDDGVDGRHPDLKGALSASFDAWSGDSFQEPKPWDSHGTACAGLAVGQGKTDEGVRGVAAGCSLYAIRIAYSESVNDDWQMTFDRAATGISWAWKNGADILSLSWHSGVSTDIIEEIEKALSAGRKGKGCVVVAAAGNHGGAVNFPANFPGVVCVSASNQFDQIKTRDSADGETNWASCVGREVCVSAPGIANWTSDNIGTDGFVAGDYDSSFSGTSASTPIVAGACALVLSAKPSLKGADVVKIIMTTADKVGSAPYTGERNDEFGHGRLNVLKAVQAAKTTRRSS